MTARGRSSSQCSCGSLLNAGVTIWGRSSRGAPRTLGTDEACWVSPGPAPFETGSEPPQGRCLRSKSLTFPECLRQQTQEGPVLESGSCDRVAGAQQGHGKAVTCTGRGRLVGCWAAADSLMGSRSHGGGVGCPWQTREEEGPVLAPVCTRRGSGAALTAQRPRAPAWNVTPGSSGPCPPPAAPEPQAPALAPDARELSKRLTLMSSANIAQRPSCAWREGPRGKLLWPVWPPGPSVSPQGHRTCLSR